MSICPICSGNENKAFLCKVNLIFDSEYDLIECKECKCIYFSPMPSDHDLEIFYSGAYFNFSRWHDEAKGSIYAKKLSKIKDKGNFLDVGCALGFFINGIKRNSNWNVFGVEYGKSAVEYASKNLGLNVKQGELYDINFPNKYFDYIHINNVLEHVRDPGRLLGECKRIIKDDGYLFLSVPNGYNDSRPLIEFYKLKKVPTKSISGHIYFFPKETLLKLFKDFDFEIISKKTGSIKRGMRNIGLLNKKKNWEQSYYPDAVPKDINEDKVVVSETKKYSDFYYKYRYIQSKYHDLPGLYNFGLDYIFLLKLSDEIISNSLLKSS
jgi:2-polyprenyl-3-methyl-5-hydroxy-6-metoxy-1,4-benzoquinol methylase